MNIDLIRNLLKSVTSVVCDTVHFVVPHEMFQDDTKMRFGSADLSNTTKFI